MKYIFWFSLKFEKFWSYFHKFLGILIWNILILLSYYFIFVILYLLCLKGLQVLCSQYFQVLEICLSIVHISKTIVKFFERFHFGIILPVML